MGDSRTSALDFPKIYLVKSICMLTVSRVVLLMITVAIFIGGCQKNDQPKFRVGSFFGSPMGMTFTDPNNLGTHSSNGEKRKDEKTGMVYTCKGGFIDMGHLREGIDRTAFLTELTKKNLSEGKTEFNFKIIEPSVYWVKITLPGDWEDKTEASKTKIINEASIYLGQYFAHTSMIWHEIITWYGYSSTGIFPENISSFSWEDTYSDIMGTCIAVEALLTDSSNFDMAVTRLINRTMLELDAQSPKVARQAAEQIKGKWFTGNMYIFVAMKKHNFDVGFGDGSVTPLLVPGICPDAKPLPCPTPDMKFLKRLGIKLQLEIEPKSLERKKIFNEINLAKDKDRMIPSIHFPLIIGELRRKVIANMGENSSRLNAMGKE
ncbi:MAG: DUF4056 domain-containing protein [Phycisphaerae bacterium]|nr:DUF4056 domain-containing protein [Phycisphaerae bacterium]